MEQNVHNMNNLFAQLGKPSNDSDIARFLATHGPLANEVPLHEAPFWTPTQAEFLRDDVCEHSDWAEVVDELNAGLHARQ